MISKPRCRSSTQNVNAGSLQSWQLQFDKVGNLTERFDARTGQREVLTYDKLDRLTNVTRNGVANLGLAYDDLGNICSKTKELAAAQTYSYGAAAGCSNNFASGTSPHQVKTAFGKTFNYDANGDMTSRSIAGSSLTMNYDASRLSRVIASTGANNAKSSFWYAPGGSRYKRIDEKNGSIIRTVRYFGALEKEVTPTKTLIRESIGGFLLINREITNTSIQRQYRYMFADHLGSVDLITNELGSIIERMSFDAHGNRRIDNSWSNSVLNYAPNTTLLGFTGQEMLDDLGLVHMNARIYDPELGRFLQADSEVENDATQGLNRYSYCLNNPLSLTDPTGHRSKALGYLKAAISIALSVWLPGSGLLFGANTFGAYVFAGFVSGTISGGLQGGLEGAFSAAIFYGIGSHFSKLAGDKGTGFLGSGLKAGKFAQKVLAHATAGGVIGALKGGNFGQAFVSAGVTEAAASTIDGNLHSAFAKVATSAMVGGSVSYLAGGKFGNGAATAAAQMAFNELSVKITRHTYTENSIVSTIEVSSDETSEQFTGYALEDTKAGPNGDKDPILPGAYAGFTRTDGKMGFRIELLGVPHFGNVQIHTGNSPADVMGCFAVGTVTTKNYVSQSKMAMEAIQKISVSDASGKYKVTVMGSTTMPEYNRFEPEQRGWDN
jgi:RHS repeat-associated protein